MPEASILENPSVRSQRHPIALRAEWLALGSVCLATSGQLILKAGLTLSKTSAASLHAGVGLILGGILIYGLGTLLWIAAVARADISYLYPLSALNYLLVALGGALLLGEHIGVWRWGGIATMSIGVALLVCSREGKRT